MKDKLSQIESQFLVMAAQNGSAEAWEKLVALWQEKLWRYVFGLTADKDAAWDITQQAWLEMIKGLKKLHNPKNFKAWAYRIATNRSIDWFKARNKNRHIDVESIQVASNEKNEDSQIKEMVEKLKTDSRIILSLYYFEQLTIAEISIALNIPAGTVKSRMFKAREELKQLWEKHAVN
ncbi:MAG: RNA polymerase sigma factor [Planctomycetota bacterium]|jgi:RNA polymerase sigma-70 factor (ECF subfamily)